MRPERLRISAFGPYAGEEDMDFSVLENHTLFLICGPTGAGKSTILDAMCSMGKPAAPSDREKICGATMWGMTEKPMWNLTLP